MKSKNLLIILLISITLIYLSLINKQNSTYKIDYQETYVEHFAEDPKARIANLLGFDISRMKNFKEIGDSSKANEYQIEFEINPRSINQINELTINDLVKKFSKLKTNLIENPLSIVNSANKTILLSKINFQQLENKKLAELRELETKFENQEFIPAAKYLESLHRGVPKDVWIEPRYKFENNTLVLEPLPTPTKSSTTPTPTPTPTSISTTTTPPRSR